MGEYKTIMWDLKCPFHNIPLLADKDSVFCWCPKCECSYFIYELRDPVMRQALIEKCEKEKVCT